MIQSQPIMATLKLKKSPGAPAPHKPLRPGAPRPRPTLAQAQAERAARAAPRPAQHAERPPRPAAPGPSGPTPAPAAEPREGERLSKRMAALGLASRREADEWIEAGWVKVNGQLAVLGQRVQPDDRVDIDPAARHEQAQRITVLLHKPIGYVSGQAEDGYQPAAVLVTAANHWSGDRSDRRFHPGHARGLAPAGRLDIDSTGLLVLTQDGRIAKLLIGDDSKVEKEYLVRVQYTRPGPFPEEDLKRLNHGLELDGKPLKPAKVSWQNEEQLRFVLREGRKRQIRRMCELVGLKVLALKRVRIGSVVLGQLPPGQWRYLRADERF
jgi:23S rRNA pseudouridine2604 synthase